MRSLLCVCVRFAYVKFWNVRACFESTQVVLRSNRLLIVTGIFLASDATLARENVQLEHENQHLREANIALPQNLDGLKRQIFGEKSEKRPEIDFAHQADMLANVTPVPLPPPIPQNASKSGLVAARSALLRRLRTPVCRGVGDRDEPLLLEAVDPVTLSSC